jgi:hypothetical protein
MAIHDPFIADLAKMMPDSELAGRTNLPAGCDPRTAD